MAKRLTYTLHRQANGRQLPQWLQLRWWLPGIMLILLITGGWFFCQWLQDPDNLPIAHVYIEAPTQHVTREVIQNKINPYIEEGFVTMSVAELQQAIKQLPWIAKVTVRRIWPDSLVITVQEQQAVARWSKLGVLNPQGDIFYPALDTVPKGLPYLEGPDDLAKTVLNSYQSFAKILSEAELKIKAISVNARHAWEITLENNTIIRLGHSDFEMRLQRLVNVWPKLIKDRKEPIISVDLRYPNGMAVH